jgi:hypothetical protein
MATHDVITEPPKDDPPMPESLVEALKVVVEAIPRAGINAEGQIVLEPDVCAVADLLQHIADDIVYVRNDLTLTEEHYRHYPYIRMLFEDLAKVFRTRLDPEEG